MNLSYEDIIRAWQCSASVAEACKKLNGAKASLVQYRIGRLRKLGVPLKQMPRARGPALSSGQVEAFKALARKYVGGAP